MRNHLSLACVLCLQPLQKRQNTPCIVEVRAFIYSVIHVGDASFALISAKAKEFWRRVNVDHVFSELTGYLNKMRDMIKSDAATDRGTELRRAVPSSQRSFLLHSYIW